MRKLVTLIIVLVVMLTVALPTSAAAQGIPAIVVNCDSYVSLRAYPSMEADRLAKVSLGQEITVLSNAVYPYEENYFIQAAYNGMTGYILVDYIDVIVDSGNPLLQTSVSPNATGYVCCRERGDDLIMRYGPGTEYGIVGLLFGGEVATYLGETRTAGNGREWYHCEHLGADCWISSRYSMLVGGQAPQNPLITPEPIAPEPIAQESMAAQADNASDFYGGSDARKPAGGSYTATVPSDSNRVQDPFFFARDISGIQFGGIEKSQGDTIRSFSGKKSAYDTILNYAEMLGSGEYNFKLNKKYDSSINNLTTFRSTFVYTGTRTINTHVSLLDFEESTVGNGQVYVYCFIEGDRLKGTIRLASGLEFEDLGLRAGGKNVEVRRPWDGAYLDVVKDPENNDDWSMYIADGTKHLACRRNIGAVMRIDDELAVFSFNCEYSRKNGRYEFMVEDNTSDDCLAFTIPGDMMYAGAELDMKQYGRDSTLVENEFVHSNGDLLFWYGEQAASFGVHHSGDYMFAQSERTNAISDVYVKVHLIDAETNTAVIYFAAAFDASPLSVEGLVAFTLPENEGKTDANEIINLDVGGQYQISFSGREYMPDYELYHWSVVSGADLIRLSDESSSACVIKAVGTGKAVIQCQYDYGGREADVLTGIERRVGKSKTLTYELNIQ